MANAQASDGVVFLSLSVSLAHRSPHLTQRYREVPASAPPESARELAPRRALEWHEATEVHDPPPDADVLVVNKYYLGVLCLEMTENGDDRVHADEHDFVLSDGWTRPTDTPEASA